MRRREFSHAALIGILLTGILPLGVAALLPSLVSLPAQAQTPNFSDADKDKKKNNEDEIKKLKSKERKVQKEMRELDSDMRKQRNKTTSASAAIFKNLYNKYEEKAQESKRLAEEINFRTLSKKDFSNKFQAKKKIFLS